MRLLAFSSLLLVVLGCQRAESDRLVDVKVDVSISGDSTVYDSSEMKLYQEKRKNYDDQGWIYKLFAEQPIPPPSITIASGVTEALLIDANNQVLDRKHIAPGKYFKIAGSGKSPISLSVAADGRIVKMLSISDSGYFQVTWVSGASITEISAQQGDAPDPGSGANPASRRPLPGSGDR